MPQLNLNFLEIPIPETCLWEQFDDAQKQIVIGDADGIYHPALFNDRLLLGLKGTMSEAELHIIRARLDGGIRNKAARGELRRGLPVGFVWGDEDGEVLIHPKQNQAGGAIREGSALLQGIAVCGHCGRRLRIYYSGKNSTPGYYCSGKDLVNGRGVYCLNIGGVAIDQAVVQ